MAERAVAVLVALREPADEALDAVRGALVRYGELEASDLGTADLEALRSAGERLAPVVDATTAGDAARAINELLQAYAGTPRLTAHGHTPWHLHVDASDDDEPWARWFMASTAMGLAVMVAETQRPPLGRCASPGCGRPFVRSTHGAPRRYCSSTCGTRERVAGLRASRRT